jgi:hypothetical protein
MEPTREQLQNILLGQGFEPNTIERILNGEIKAVSPDRVEEKIAEAQNAIAELQKEIAEGDQDDFDDDRLDLTEIFKEEEPASNPVSMERPAIEVEFNPDTCPTCNTTQIQKERALEKSRKSEMILVIRDIVGRFKTEYDVRLTTLSNKIQDQLRPIVAAAGEITVAKHDLEISLIRLEDDLKRAFGCEDVLDPRLGSEALFLESEQGEPVTLFDAPEPGEDPVFDKLSSDVDAALEKNDPANDRAKADTRSIYDWN